MAKLPDRRRPQTLDPRDVRAAVDMVLTMARKAGLPKVAAHLEAARAEAVTAVRRHEAPSDPS